MAIEMENEEQKISISRIRKDRGNRIEDVVARESPLTIILNDQELVTLLCSPVNQKYLALGFLFSEGLIKSKDEVKKLMVDERRGIVRVETFEDRSFANELMFKRFITSGCGKGASFYTVADAQNQTKVESQIQVSTHDILSLVSDFQRRSQVYKETGGVHSAALCDTENILVFSEDIGRHNALDKIFGECILKDISVDGRIVISSGRISSDMLLKVAKRSIPIIVSKSAPTDLGVKLAQELSITLIGFARGRRMNVYANEWRVTSNEK